MNKQFLKTRRLVYHKPQRTRIRSRDYHRACYQRPLLVVQLRSLLVTSSLSYIAACTLSLSSCVVDLSKRPSEPCAKPLGGPRRVTDLADNTAYLYSVWLSAPPVLTHSGPRPGSGGEVNRSNHQLTVCTLIYHVTRCFCLHLCRNDDLRVRID